MDVSRLHEQAFLRASDLSMMMQLQSRADASKSRDSLASKGLEVGWERSPYGCQGEHCTESDSIHVFIPSLLDTVGGRHQGYAVGI